MAEFINLSPNSDKITPYFGSIFDNEPLPKNGFIKLPDKPGFGVNLNYNSLIRPHIRS
jgi:L-rhamnonate dehydratase